MSLRFKALLAAIALVAIVSGALGWHVRNDWAAQERKRITRDLRQEASDLKRSLKTLGDFACDKLEVQIFVDPELKILIRGRDDRNNPIRIGDSFLNPALRWKDLIQADGALATQDSFQAQEETRQTKILKEFEDLAVIAMTFENQSFLNDLSLQQFLQESFILAESQTGPVRKILSAIGSVWLVVAAPFYEDASRTIPQGQGVVFFELSSNWLKKIRADLLKTENPVRHIIYQQNQISGQTLGDLKEAQKVIEKANQVDNDLFEMTLKDADGSSRYIALRQFLVSPGGPSFIALKNLDAELAGLNALIKRLWKWGAGLGFLGVILTYFLAMTVVTRLEKLRKAAGRVREGDFQAKVPIQGKDEVAALGTAFNQMTEGLKALGVYTDPFIAKAILSTQEDHFFRGDRAEGCVFFSDIRDFTAISEGLEPEDLVAQLNEYFSGMGQNVKEGGGYLDKFIGDSVMAWWGPPFKDQGSATAACQAALACVQFGADLRADWEEKGKPLFHQRIGLAYGEVVVGNLGSQTKKNFTVVGNTVNLASRLEGANFFYGTEIIVCEQTARRAQGIVFREIDRVRVKGQMTPMNIFECLGQEGEVAQETLEIVKAYEKALDCYRKKDFEKALEIIEPGCQAEDGPSLWLNIQCEALLAESPDEDWEPVTVYRSK